MWVEGERRAKRATADSASRIRGSARGSFVGAFTILTSPSAPDPRRRPLVSDATSASMDVSLSLPLHAASPLAPPPPPPAELELLENSKLELLLTTFACNSATEGGEHWRRVNFPSNDLLGGRMV